MSDSEFDKVWQEHLRRCEALAVDYDPRHGKGCSGPRFMLAMPDGSEVMAPETMRLDPGYEKCLGDQTAMERLRCKHDFEYWAIRCVRVKDKESGADVPFKLNAPQRRVWAMLDEDRRASRPMRLIMLKARQWGGSTLVQMLMAWIQSYWRRNWHSLICAHVKDTSATIRGMYTKMLASYPEEMWDGDEAPRFVPFERSQNVREIAGRGCRVTLGSSENQEAVRGGDYAMAHLSEVAFWASSAMKSPEKFVQAICGSVARVPLSLVVMESTANGVGNFFHREWTRAIEGKSDKRVVFVPWYEIEIYRAEVDRPAAERLWAELDSYERGLWDNGRDLGQIMWYHEKRREYQSPTMMQAEYPTTATEAFVNTGHNVFAVEHIEAMRPDCRPPLKVGELGLGIEGLAMKPSPLGALKVWTEPEKGHRYVAAVDIGGRSATADWSVIAVIDNSPGIVPEVVAQWRGHIDHDLLGDKSVELARYYNNALLVIESNTLETESGGGADTSLFILERLRRRYRNLYMRQSFDTVDNRPTLKVGFHTNQSTKRMVITGLIGLVRDHGYIERDPDALDELSTYELTERGSYEARRGCHDDILMTRAIGLHVAMTGHLRPTTATGEVTALPRW